MLDNKLNTLIVWNNLVKLSSDPIWISHRGIRDTGYTENTRAAYDLAIERGFHWLETDLRLSSDEHIVLVHDQSLHRLTGQNQNVDTFSREQLSALKLKCGQSLLFLDEFITRFSHHKWVFDVKPESSARCIKVLRKLIDGMSDPRKVEEKITFLMWLKEDEDEAKRLFPNANFFAQEEACWRAGLAALLGLGMLSGVEQHKAYAVVQSLWGLSLYQRRIFDVYHQRQGQVIAYLPDQPELVRKAIEAGTDYILSDSLIFGQEES